MIEELVTLVVKNSREGGDIFTSIFSVDRVSFRAAL